MLPRLSYTSGGLYKRTSLVCSSPHTSLMFGTKLKLTRISGPKPVTIAVMGPTGAGKTSFINLASGSELRIEAGLESATDSVQLSKPFLLDGYMVTLIDTPGFDDTSKSDSDVLTIIADYLSATYQKGERLSGVLYLHRITDNRMGGTALRNFGMFTKLCGRAICNSGIVLNMWNEVNPEVGAAREAELTSKDIFFKPALQAGARMFHHDNSQKSAFEILRYIAGRSPKPLLIQKELVNQQKHICDTAAGMALLGDLAAKERKHLEELRQMKSELDEAIRRKDEEDRRELEDARLRLEEVRSGIAKQKQNLQLYDIDVVSDPRKPSAGLRSVWFRLYCVDTSECFGL